MKQKIEKIKLKSGLEVVFLFDKAFTTSSLKMLFKIGWRNDTESERGLAHLFEHLVGKRTKKYGGKSEFAEKLEIEGIVSNAYTGPDITVYYQNQTNQKMMTSLGLLYEAIYNTNFVKEDLEQEKNVVMTEARRYLDNDDSVAWRQVFLNLYKGSTMEKFFFGDDETMKNITLEHFEDFYNIYKNPKNSTLFVGTNDPKNKQKVLKFLNDFYEKIENKKLLSNAKIPAFKDVYGEIVKHKVINKNDKSQSKLRLAYRLDFTLSDKEQMTFGVLSQILTGGLTGKLMKLLRDEMGLVYGIGMFWSFYSQGVSYVGIGTECNKDKKELLLKTVKDFLKKYVSEISKEDIKKVIPQREYNAQKPVFVASDLEDLLDSTFYKRKYIQTEEALKILKKITPNDVKKLMNKIFLENNSTVVVLE
jgi:predicted Zn-dependent peptidase